MRIAAPIAAALAFVAIGTAAPAYAGNEKTAICHATSSAVNPYVYIEISVKGVQDGHMDHSDDIIPPLSDIGLPLGRNWTEDNQALLERKCADLPDTGAGDYAMWLVGGTALLGAGWLLTRRKVA